ncbi:MAG TPA: polyamine aminopropyltransferase [Spirochaetota bacterium]|nr:polyamine aminopropyltransferase [Spirochaetota bacterium]HPH03663.1 polyamine aminopropyltransferase [Spirochaetota bacterium]HPN83201.1 polyamine aminopropyltransferase [Spirochaetota bacterium]
MTEPLDRKKQGEVRALLFSILLTSVCAITYELLIGAVSSYLTGNSVVQYSLTIGIFLSAMGLGSWLSRWLTGDLVAIFADVELGLGLLGGLSLIILYSVYLLGDLYMPVFILLSASMGTLIGFEIPLVTRIMRSYGPLSSSLSTVLTFDYVGGLAASLLFPFILLPVFGMIRTAFVTGIFNILVVLVLLNVFRERIARPLRIGATLGGLLALCSVFFASDPLAAWYEQQLYQDTVMHSEQSQFQKIVLTGWRDDTRLWLDGSLQFSTVDEYRYHESLVQPAMTALPGIERALVMGGGDGMAVREILKRPEVKEIHLVDLDPAITRLAQTHPALVAANSNALADPRVRIFNKDAFKFLEETGTGLYDLIVADFPDPHNEVLSKLYSREIYRLVRHRLARAGVFVTQAASPFFAREVFWMIHATLSEVFPHTVPYHENVPSFGDWGFVMASAIRWQPDWTRLPARLRHITPAVFSNALGFAPDSTRPKNRIINTLNTPRIYQAYQRGWKNYN